MGDLRTGQRIAFKTKAVVTWIDREGNPCTAIGECLDLSEGGMKVSLPVALELRTYVSVRCEAAQFHGSASVRSCSHSHLAYELGLEFTGGSKASAGRSQHGKSVFEPVPRATGPARSESSMNEI